MAETRETRFGRSTLRCAIAIAVVLAAFLLRSALVLQFGFALPVFITFYPAIMVVALVYGLWPGLLATLAATFLSAYWILSPSGSFRIESTSDFAALSLFLGMGVFISFVAERSRRNLHKMAAFERDLALSDTRSELEAALTSMTDAVFISDINGAFVDFNEAFATFHRFKTKSECARNFAEYPSILEVFTANGEPVPVDMWAVPRALRGESATCAVYRLRRKDTGQAWVGSYSFSPILDTEGAIVGSVVVARDITEVKRVEARLRRLYETDMFGVVYWNMNRTVVDANDKYLQITGYARQDVRAGGLNQANITAPECGYLDEEARRQLRETGSYQPYEKEIIRKDGTRAWAIYSGAAYDDDRNLGVSFVLDITERKLAERSLRESEEKYRTLFDTLIEGFCIVEVVFDARRRPVDLRFLEVNPAFEAQTGMSGAQGKSMREIAPDFEEHWFEICGRVALTGEPARFENEARPLKRWFEGFAYRVGGPESQRVAVLFNDIGERKRAEDTLRASEARYRTAFQTSLDAIVITRLSDGKYIEASQAFRNIMGFERVEVLGKTSLELNLWVDIRDRQRLLEVLAQDASCRDFQTQFRRKNGETFWGVLSVSAIEIDGESCILSVIRDNSEVRLAQEEIRNLSFFDRLTGLANRRLLMERLPKSMTESAKADRQQALLFIDLDDFKTLNSVHGHRAGDLLLREVATRLTACAREGDTVCRVGSDEFVVMLDNLSEIPEDAAGEAMAVAESILASVDLPYLLDGRECISTCSIGITVFDDDRGNMMEFLQQADIAMHQAKAAGRNTMRFFSPSLQAAVNERAAMEEDLRHAIKTNQFTLYYQPQVEDGQLIGAEALLRWNHPRLGLLSPYAFISLAEETQLILPLGNWALEAACKQIAAWARGTPSAGVQVAVNVSAVQLRKQDFVESVLAALDRAGADPHRLKLELTESMLVDNVEDAIAKMMVLKAHGVSFALDDFGTGYSSLAYLKRLPLDQLKIDLSFVRDILADASSFTIAQTIVSLGHAMGLEVIAEGVESEQQRNLLVGLGCHCFQGYLFGKPMPLEQFEALILGSAGDTVEVLP